jgi:hypothetical protein
LSRRWSVSSVPPHADVRAQTLPARTHLAISRLTALLAHLSAAHLPISDTSISRAYDASVALWPLERGAMEDLVVREVLADVRESLRQ